jgi:hypothetical protein
MDNFNSFEVILAQNVQLLSNLCLVRFQFSRNQRMESLPLSFAVPCTEARAAIDELRGRPCAHCETEETRERWGTSGAAELAAAPALLTELRQVCEQLRTPLEAEIPIPSRVAAEHRRQQTISTDSDLARQAVAQMRAEREALFSEIRTIDFIIYDCTGQFQLPNVVNGRR